MTIMTDDRNAHALALSLSQILQKTDRILTGNEKVAVTGNVQSPDSWSIGNNITLGFRGLNLTDQEDITCAIGLNYHELAHVCLTPRNVGDAFNVRSEKTNNTRYVFSAFNYLEDARIETLFGARYDAMRYYFTVTFIAKVLRDDDALSQHVQSGGGDPKLLSLSSHLLAHGRRFLPADIRTELRNRALNEWQGVGDHSRIKRAEEIFNTYRTMTRRELAEVVPITFSNWPGTVKTPRFLLAASRLHDLFPELFTVPNDHGSCSQRAAMGTTGGLSNPAPRETAQEKKKEESDADQAKQDEKDDYEEIEVSDPSDEDDGEDDQESGQDEETESEDQDDQDDDDDPESGSEGDDDGSDDGDEDGDGYEGDDGEDDQDDESPQGGSNRSGEDSEGEEDDDSDSDDQGASGGSGDPSGEDTDGSGDGDASGDGASSDEEGATGAGSGADENSPLTDSEMREALSSVKSSVTDNSVISSEVDRIAQDVARMGEQSDENFVVRSEPSDGETRDAIAELSHILSGLQDKVAPGWNYGSDHGRLNVGRVMAGADFEEIYDEWDEGKEDDASSEVVFLLDQSGSMGGPLIYSASRLLHSLRSALLSIDANVTIYGFSTRIVNVLKGRDDKTITDDIPIYGTIAGTEIKPAMSYAVDVFNQSDAKNRIFVVITDGIWSTETTSYMSMDGLDAEHRRLLSEINATKVLCFINKSQFMASAPFAARIKSVENEFDFAFDAASPGDLLDPIATVVEQVVANSVS